MCDDAERSHMALVHFDTLKDTKATRSIAQLPVGYDDKSEYFVDQLAYGLARIAAANHPAPVIARTSDFKTTEYANLIGGVEFEPKEENPMLGFRGACRYFSRAIATDSRSNAVQSVDCVRRWASRM